MSATDNGIRGRVALLVLDCERPTARAALDGWLDKENAALVWPQRKRFFVDLAIDTQGNPRYHHCIELAHDIETVIESLQSMTITIELIGEDLGMTSPCMVDTRLLLEPTDTARIDAWLSGHTAEFLRHTSAAGHA